MSFDPSLLADKSNGWVRGQPFVGKNTRETWLVKEVVFFSILFKPTMGFPLSFFITFFTFLTFVKSGGTEHRIESSHEQASQHNAFVALLYGHSSDRYVLGVEVLFQTLIDTNSIRRSTKGETEIDMVALVTEEVPEKVLQDLKNMGVKVRITKTITNSYEKFDKRFSGVLTKLAVFNMTEYRFIVRFQYF